MFYEQIQRELAEIQEAIDILNRNGAYAQAQADRCAFEALIISEGIAKLAQTEADRKTAEISFIA